MLTRKTPAEGEWPTWATRVRSALRADGEGFVPVSSHEGGEAGPPRGAVAPSRDVSRLRGWIYRDVHARATVRTISHLGYSELPFTRALLRETIVTAGWHSRAGALVHRGRRLTLADASAHADGFMIRGDCVEVPRLRSGTSAGWLTIAGRNGSVSTGCHRLYAPGIGLEQLEEVVEALDSVPGGVPWSMKSSTAVDRNGKAVVRADRTVIYVDPAREEGTTALPGIVAAVSSFAPAADGPGFSVPLSAGVYFGGSGNEYGSFGTKMATLAAQGLLHDDLSLVDAREQELQRRAVITLDAGVPS